MARALVAPERLTKPSNLRLENVCLLNIALEGLANFHAQYLDLPLRAGELVFYAP